MSDTTTTHRRHTDELPRRGTPPTTTSRAACREALDAFLNGHGDGLTFERSKGGAVFVKAIPRINTTKA